ncbi:copine-5, putative [Entamoeba invadens IP1]|uniref:Copine-5, putative n=1 Tax=Entamoeba invadens IP1 TaxID=370355 RepID=A0A0A1U5H0_ENTIV|nr:copine-5, putative [Entamoeba invadens IP1]ELP89567.1 copine-5, putative [Entamoeba invadens IP1]|eukprot:XP_004256338.1 copine-5, putative [Entamoeba invadens IP1]
MGNDISGVNSGTEITCPYKTLEELQEVLKKEGLKDSNLIVGIDMTGSNISTGKQTYKNNLHFFDGEHENPYMRVMDIMARALKPFDEDGLIPVFGFGAKKEGANELFFDLNPEGKMFVGIEKAIEQYKITIPTLTFSGPTTFVPLIEHATQIVQQNDQAFHVLIIITDGQLSDVDENIVAIEEASNNSLSIVCVGVGDGPFGVMYNLQKVVRNSKFNNFTFIDFNSFTNKEGDDVDVSFAFAAMRRIPQQYIETERLFRRPSAEDQEPEKSDH